VTRFQHAKDLRDDFTDLVAGVVAVTGVTPDADVSRPVALHTGTAAARLAGGPLAEFPEIQAWRRAFAKMGLKPTQYRCASEALLRRLSKTAGLSPGEATKDGSLPSIHPMVDLCNAVSMAYGIPVAALDLGRVDGDLEVRYADGTEVYETFAGDTEHPDVGEVSFVDSAGRAHARRWTNRQSGWSAVRPATSDVLIVAEALHTGARADVERLLDSLATAVVAAWGGTRATAVLTSTSPSFDL
jgi:DNA/RNA-binding domain of Phe-tRNA-synthetase-like protein